MRPNLTIASSPDPLGGHPSGGDSTGGLQEAIARGEADADTIAARADALLGEQRRLLIGGELVEASGGRTFPSISPWTEEEIARVPDADAGDALRVVDAACAAAPAWAAVPLPDRVRLVQRAADVLEERLDDFAVLDTADAGSPIRLTLQDGRAAVEAVRRLAGIAPELRGSTIPATDNLHLTVREPYGVALRIVAYNHPFMFAATKIAAPLLTGNTVIIKPSELAPLSALLMGEVLQDVFPPGVLSVVTGRDAALPRALVRDPRVRRIGFIGSAPTGRSIQRDAAEGAVKHVTLELGGKNALIAYPDVDPAEVARAAVEGMNFTWSGQSCMSTSRLLVHEAIADEVVAHAVEIIEARRLGSPFDPRSEQGTIVSRGQHDRILGLIDRAVAEGARIRTGGRRPDGGDRGLVIPPTVLDMVRPGQTVEQTEVFGPVLSVIRWGDQDDPVAIANGVQYGLTANIWTNDVTRALTVARRLEVGYVWVNGWPRLYAGVPFGGVKNSGVGVEDALEELESYTTSKSVNVIFRRG
ncbi:aldehyde dehydrogenase family protein [Blastococcus sp. CT_GayMR20]|uniref:aldehyde dehydrogenase family protein n=1 Tax=Blastococcus sp. CT_GayMR20 TaxID=2559609 RepID=UPI001FD7DB19|nr:aldehyde dehydrogenase family protein [Blastococcus sp. CT_GayMR20]